MPGAFTDKVNNNANIGKATDEIVYLWNEENPDDPIVLETEPAPEQ